MTCKTAVIFSQPAAPWHYQYYNSAHGLPSSEIICLAKDYKGFLWLGTSAGLSKYDGYSFENHAWSKENELIGYVHVIKAGAGNRLWIGSGAGLFCYTDNEIIKISATSSLPQGVNDILPDKDGSLWLATENGPVKISIKELDFSGRKKIVLADHLLKQWTLKYAAFDIRRTVFISKASDGTVYIAGQTAVYRLRDDSLSMVYHTTITRDKINALFAVSKSTVYFDAASTELHALQDGHHTSSNPQKLYTAASIKDSLPGSWYIGTRGAFYFHPQTGTISASIVFTDKYLVWPTAVLQDNGFYWVASHDGLVKLKPSLFTSYPVNTSASFIDYYSVTSLKNGKLLLGANFGKIVEKKDNDFPIFKDKLVPGAEIKGLYEDGRGWLWIATGYQGMVLLRNGKAERFTTENGLHDNSLYQFCSAANGKFYVVGDQGMSEIIVQADQSISFKKYNYTPNISQYAKFFSGTTAPDGNIWLGGEEGIAYLHMDSLQKFSFSGKEFQVNFLMKDSMGKVWLATSGDGIVECAFNKKNELEIVQQYTENDGLNTLHYISLMADKENNIWAGSSKGITLIGRQGKFKDRVLNFDASDGFIKPGYSSIRLHQDGKGSIWAATTLGFMSFNPDHLLPPESSPVVYITGTGSGETSKLNTVGKDQADLQNKFSYTNNSFRFNYTALDYANQENIRYYYQLNGLDSNWTNGGQQRSTSYENLSPGSYSFHVKALDSKGNWSKEDAIYAFTIVPPIWKTWWFMLFVLAGCLLLCILLLRKRIGFVKNRESQKTALQQIKASAYREQLEIEQIINHFATSMNHINSIDDVLWDVARNCISILNFEDCVIYLVDEKRNVLVQKAGWGPKTTKENRILNPLEIPCSHGITGSVAESGKAAIISNTSTDERYIVDDVRRLSEIAVPIVNDGKVIGIIDSEHSRENFYTERHLQVLTTIASLCAGKIETIKAEQQTREKEMEVLRLQKDVATSQLTALRMQMNPHFIFNALNSVQHYILQGNVVEANKYLSKFSRLQREILHCSSQHFITLEKEIEILSSYLQLEQFRFGGNFVYQVNMTNEIEPAEIKIPPMVLQPFVENAIWHGLMPLQTERNLQVYFDLHSDDILLATIRDNGIGRTASAKLKQSSDTARPEHASKGMSIVQERLQLLQQQYDKPFEASISDITDMNGCIAGTQVTLKIFIGNKKS